MWKEKLITNNPFIQILIEGSLENKLPWHTISEKKNTMIKKKKPTFLHILEDCVPTKLQKTAVSTVALRNPALK